MSTKKCQLQYVQKMCTTGVTVAPVLKKRHLAMIIYTLVTSKLDYSNVSSDFGIWSPFWEVHNSTDLLFLLVVNLFLGWVQSTNFYLYFRMGLAQSYYPIYNRKTLSCCKSMANHVQSSLL